MSQATVQPVQGPVLGETIIHARGVRKSFRMGDSTVNVLKQADFTLKSGEFVAIEGRSGSGKSTLLHILGALDSVDAGTVAFNGTDYTISSKADGATKVLRSVTRWSFWIWIIAAAVRITAGVGALFVYQWFPDAAAILAVVSLISVLAVVVALAFWLILLAIRSVRHHLFELPLVRLRNRQFGFVFQFYYLLPELNVLENTLLAPMVEQSLLRFILGKAERTARAKLVLEQLGMGHRLKHRPAQLSGGERQRVAIARALMNRPKVLFADEPTGNLDAETGRQIMGVLEELHQKHGQTIVMVTHDRTLAREADRTLVLQAGRLEPVAE